MILLHIIKIRKGVFSMNVNNEALQRAAEQFAQNMEKYPIEEQIAVSCISKNVLNGCSWEFVRSNPDLRRNADAFASSQSCELKEVTYSHNKNISGYLILMSLNRLVDILGREALGVFDQASLKKAMDHRHDAVLAVAKLMKKGYRGRIGIFCTNDSPTITVDGVSYPAFAITLNELCDICSRTGYGFAMGSQIRTADQVKAHADAVLKACTVAPSSNALFIDIAPLN